MGKGILEVHLVGAKGLSGNDFLGGCRRRVASPLFSFSVAHPAFSRCSVDLNFREDRPVRGRDVPEPGAQDQRRAGPREEPELGRGAEVPDQHLRRQRAAQARPPDHGPRQLLQRRLPRRSDVSAHATAKNSIDVKKEKKDDGHINSFLLFLPLFLNYF
jgi:hypothetical protein